MLPQFPALDANWRETLRLEKRAVIFCWAAWSIADKMLASVLARIIPGYEDRFSFFTANLDDEVLVPFFVESQVLTCPNLLLWCYGKTAPKPTASWDLLVMKSCARIWKFG